MNAGGGGGGGGDGMVGLARRLNAGGVVVVVMAWLGCPASKRKERQILVTGADFRVLGKPEYTFENTIFLSIT